MEKKEFFEKISKLSLEEKIAAIKEEYSSSDQSPTALNLISVSVLRARSYDLGQKICLLRANLPKTQAYESVKLLLNEERRRRKKHEAENLPDTLSLERYLKENVNFFGWRDTKHILKQTAAFLTLKREMGEKVGDKDCEGIKMMLNVQHYHIYRDQMNRIVHMSFRFQGQKIKKIAFAFFDEVLTQNKSIEVGILFNLLEGTYLSKEMYSILSKHIRLIADSGLLKNVIAELKRIQKQDRHTTLAKKEKMVALIAKYETALERQN